MGLRMKNFNFLRVHWKIQLCGGGGGGECIHEKPIWRGGLPKKGTFDSLQI